jgi:hypothetical protein
VHELGHSIQHKEQRNVESAQKNREETAAMTDTSPPALSEAPSGYTDWLAELKTRIHSAQQRAVFAVNQELVLLYWQIGRDILARQSSQGWGAKVIERLAHDLRTAFPQMKGFSSRNLKYMRAFADAWPDSEFVQQAAAQLPSKTLKPPPSLTSKESIHDQRPHLPPAPHHLCKRSRTG